MATTSKSTLKKALAQTDSIDPCGLSPYVALHLAGLDHIHVHRTGSISFVHTDGAPDITDAGWVFAHYGHLVDCLRCLESDEVEVVTLPTGGVVVRTANSQYTTELRVHSVPRACTGFKRHAPGPVFKAMDLAWLAGFDASAIPAGMQPIIAADKLIIVSTPGTIRWQTLHDPEVPAHPRLSFLKAISGLTLGMIELTHAGFYHAMVDGMHIYTAAHRSTDALDMTLLGPAIPESVVLPAPRFVQALRQALQVAPDGTMVKVTAKAGVTATDAYGNVDRFSLGNTPAFPSFAISKTTAKLLADSLGQSSEAEAPLVSLQGHPDLLRITRGVCEVNFRCQLI